MEKSKQSDFNMKSKDGIVEFEDVEKLKKKKVRGLLRKRARKYECKLRAL